MQEKDFFAAQNFEERRMRKIDYIVLHCTAGPQNQTVESIQAYWKNHLGWKSPGYHHMIKPSGEIVDLLPIEFPSNGVAGFNAHSIHISYIGGVDVRRIVKDGKPVNVLGKSIDNRTLQQMCAMEFLVRKYHSMFPEAKIMGHRDFSPDKNRNGIIEPSEWMKTCPSFSVKQWLADIKLK